MLSRCRSLLSHCRRLIDPHDSCSSGRMASPSELLIFRCMGIRFRTNTDWLIASSMKIVGRLASIKIDRAVVCTRCTAASA